MYQSLLTRKYLTSKVMPLLAALAVMLCVATEIIVWSVMGGFLQTFVGMGRKLIGDVSITEPRAGIAHYDELLRRLREDPLVAAASPTIETQGMLKLPSGLPDNVLVKGIDPDTYSLVTDFADTVWWKPLKDPLPKDKERLDPRLNPKNEAVFTRAELAARTMSWETLRGEQMPAAVLGMEIMGTQQLRTKAGYLPESAYQCGGELQIIVLALDRRGVPIDPAARTLILGNEFKSGVYEVDANVVFVPLTYLQKMTRMDEAKSVTMGDPYAPVPPEAVGVEPARVTSILVKGKDFEGAVALRERCREIMRGFLADLPDAATHTPSVLTWRDRNIRLIAAVEKETGLVMFIFGVISITSIFLVLSIFWSMVSEKTKDIGVLRAIGAGRAGIAWLWLRYGLAIGLVGAILGGVAAFFVVRNINTIHEWLGRVADFYIWDPSVYYFTEIPSAIDWMKFAIIITVGILASVLGALIPAARAANMDPVRSLRFE